IHDRLSWRAARKRALDLLRGVWIPEPEQRLVSYPHGMAGGVRPPAAAAIELACPPKLLVAAEATTAPDTTIRLHAMTLPKPLQDEHGFALMLITHDLGVVERVCRRVAVMYGGRIIETGRTEDIMRAPRHPYTQGLIASMPRLATAGRTDGRLAIIPGSPPV